MAGKIYKGDYKTLLHTKNNSSRPFGFREEGSLCLPIVSEWELSVAMETRVLIRSGPKRNAAFPLPHDASDKIWLQSAHWLWRYLCLKVWTDERTQTTQTMAQWVYFKLTL